MLGSTAIEFGGRMRLALRWVTTGKVRLGARVEPFAWVPLDIERRLL
jgi:hypothetical protein